MSANNHVVYVENIRALLGCTSLAAEIVCETLRRERLFTRHTAYLCPNDDRVLLEIAEGDQTLPESPARLACEVCEGLEREPHEFKLGECHAITFYRLDVGQISAVTV